jgi:predicted transcriptional regulator of viral defense system
MYRLSELIKSGRNIFHTNDLAILWGISNKNTLYTTIKRDVKKGILFPIYKGLYSTIPVSQLNPLKLGMSIIHRYAYLTTESVLAQAGIISQATYAFTFVSSHSKKTTIGSWAFLFRKLKDEYLYNPIGVQNKDGLFIATTARAVADMLYFNPKYTFDFTESIDFKIVRRIQQEVGYPC